METISDEDAANMVETTKDCELYLYSTDTSITESEMF